MAVFRLQPHTAFRLSSNHRFRVVTFDVLHKTLANSAIEPYDSINVAFTDAYEHRLHERRMPAGFEGSHLSTHDGFWLRRKPAEVEEGMDITAFVPF